MFLADRLTPPISEAIILPETGLLLPIFTTSVLFMSVGLIGGILLSRMGVTPGEDHPSRPLRWRLRIRSLMLVVAVFAVLLSVDIWLRRRVEQFKLLSNDHRREGHRLQTQLRVMLRQSPVPSEADSVGGWASWHNKLSNKYERAAARPFEARRRTRLNQDERLL